MWATLIGLMDGDLDDSDFVAVGVVSAPALGMRWWATRGGGAWSGAVGQQPRRLAVSRVGSIEDCSVSYSDLHDPGWITTGTATGFNQLVNNAAKIRYRWGGSVPMVVRMPCAESASRICVAPRSEDPPSNETRMSGRSSGPRVRSGGASPRYTACRRV